MDKEINEHDVEEFRSVLRVYPRSLEKLCLNADPLQYGKRLRQLREEKSYTQTRLATLANVTKQSISLIENGNYQKISIEHAKKFMKLFECSIEYLLSYVDEPNISLSIFDRYKLENPDGVYAYLYEEYERRIKSGAIQDDAETTRMINPITFLNCDTPNVAPRGTVLQRDSEMWKLLTRCVELPDERREALKTVLKIFLDLCSDDN